jgi:hypothetical protein
MKQKYILTIAFSLCISLFSNAQDLQKKSNFMIFGVPQYLFTNGLRIDFDIHQKNTRNWFVISPYYYSDKSSVDPMNLGGNDEYYDLYSYDKLVGGGLGLSKRIFLTKKSTIDGFYLSYGACYRYFNIDGNSFTWVEYTDENDGLKKQKMDDLKYELSINSINANAVLGYMYEALPSLYLDFYMGFGVKYSIHNSPQHVTVKYNRGYYDYGYTGTQFIGGVRVGIRL